MTDRPAGCSCTYQVKDGELILSREDPDCLACHPEKHK